MNIKKRQNVFISVVVCTYRRWDFLIECIESILANRYPKQAYEVLVVGQGSDDETKDIIARKFKGQCPIKYLHVNKIGLSCARNAGYKKARGEIIAFIDDDAVASTHWLEGYREVFEEITPLPGMAGGKIKPIWEVARPEWLPQEKEFLYGLYDIGDEIRPFPEYELPIGANFAVRRDLLEKFNGFDERMGFNEENKHSMLAGEDSLLGLRIKEAGFPIYYQPKAAVSHHISAKKLKKRYFLKRHFWEGITLMTIEKLKNNRNKKWFKQVFAWHLKQLLEVGLKILKKYLKKKKVPPPNLMVRWSELAYSWGICLKSLHWILKRSRAGGGNK